METWDEIKKGIGQERFTKSLGKVSEIVVNGVVSTDTLQKLYNKDHDTFRVYESYIYHGSQ